MSSAEEMGVLRQLSRRQAKAIALLEDAYRDLDVVARARWCPRCDVDFASGKCLCEWEAPQALHARVEQECGYESDGNST